MKFIVLILAVLITITFSLHAQNENLIVGKWKTENGNGIIQIYKVNDGTFQGKIIKATPKAEKKGPLVDDKNPDPALRNRPVIGLVILRNFKFNGEMWKNGLIYDPDNGKEYSCKMWLEDNNKTLKIRGYIGISLLGRTEVWTRTD